MKQNGPAIYNGGVGRYILFLLCWMALSGALASADPQDIATTNAPIIVAQMQSGKVTIRTWDRQDVQVDGDPGLIVNHIPERAIQNHPGILQVHFWQQSFQGPDGSQLTLPPEPFQVAPLDAQPHDGVLIRGDGDVTIHIPANAPFVMANIKQGDVSLDDYHNGTFVSHIGRGSLRLNDVSGTIGAHVFNGQVIAQNSQFDRIRIRNGRGLVSFDNCDARQIEVSTLMSSIVYDHGSFQNGLARFESQKGNIAIGVARGAAQLDAHSATGRTFTDQSLRGGPVVTATSGSGNVMSTRGSVCDRIGAGRCAALNQVHQPQQKMRQQRFPARFPRPRPRATPIH